MFLCHCLCHTMALLRHWSLVLLICENLQCHLNLFEYMGCLLFLSFLILYLLKNESHSTCKISQHLDFAVSYWWAAWCWLLSSYSLPLTTGPRGLNGLKFNGLGRSVGGVVFFSQETYYISLSEATFTRQMYVCFQVWNIDLNITFLTSETSCD